MANDLSVYEEEKQVTETINAIMSKKDNFLNRIKQLYRLKLTVTSPLCHSHIDYYIHQLKSDMLTFAGHIIGLLFVMIYLIFTLFRVYWRYHPENNPFSADNKSVTIIDLIIYFYYAASAALVIYVIYRLIRRFLHKK